LPRDRQMIARAEIIAIHLSVYSAVRILVYLHFDKVQGAKVADLNCKTEVSLSIASNGVTNGRRTLWHSQSNFHTAPISGALLARVRFSINATCNPSRYLR